MARVVLVDGTGLAYRAFHALPATLKTSSGLPTNASFGFATMFRKVLARKEPELGAVVFDAPGGSFRRDLDPGYKAHRPAMPEPLSRQLPSIEKLVRAHNFPVLSIPGVEADDVIATLTARACEAGHDVIVVSGDKDLLQLVGTGVRVLEPTDEIWLDEGTVFRKYGVRPDQFVDYLALVGDPVDGVEGVPGIGRKAATEALKTHGTLDALLVWAESAEGRTASKLRVHRDRVLSSRELVRLRTDVDVGTTLESLRVTFPDPGALNEVYRELEFFSLLSAEAASSVGRGAVEYFACDTSETARAALSELDGLVAVAPLVEYPTYHRGALVGLALSPRPGRALYYPVEQLDTLRPWLEGQGQKVLHDVKATHVALGRLGVALRGVVGDTMLASYLVHPTLHLPHALEQVARAYLKRALQPVGGVVGSGTRFVRFADLPVGRAGAYACHLADAVRELWPVLARKLLEIGLLDHLRERELPLAFVLADMERHGLCVDPASMDRLGADFMAMRAAVQAEVHALARHGFDIGSHAQVGRVLFEELGLPIRKRTKTGYATSDDVLKHLLPAHPIVDRIRRWRFLDKLVHTYTDVLRDAVDPSTGRIHTVFVQTASSPGHVLTTEPDLQRTPVRSPEGRRVRELFVAAPGWQLLSADWSQMELRLLAHFTGDALLTAAFREGWDVHRRTAAEVLGKAVESVTPEERELGKLVNFATIYGQGPMALSEQIGVTPKVAGEYIDRYFKAFSGVDAWRKAQVPKALARGYVETLFGRRRIVDELYVERSRDRSYGERVAVNTPITGTAADLSKLALLRIDARLRRDGYRGRLVLLIHDEILLEVPDEEVEAVSEIVRKEMTEIAALSVPMAVDIGVGRTWSDAK